MRTLAAANPALVAIDARDLNFSDMVSFHAGKLPFDTDMPISLKLEARLAPNSAIQTLQGRFSLGAGYFKLDDPDHEPFLSTRRRATSPGTARRSATISRISNSFERDPYFRRRLARAADGVPSRVDLAISSRTTPCSAPSARASADRNR